MNTTYITFSQTDKEIFSTLKKCFTALNISDDLSINVTMGGVSRSLKLYSEISSELSLFISFTIDYSFEHIGQNHRIYILITRESNSLKVIIQHYDNRGTLSNDFDYSLEILTAFQKEFKPFSHDLQTEKILGKELADFYNKREAELFKLETLNQKILEENEKHRKTLDTEFISNKKILEKEFEDKKLKLEENFKNKEDELANREALFIEKEQQLDDRSSKHARREIIRELKKEIESRNKVFKLTDDTISKRKVIHGVFSLFIITLFVIIGYTSMHLFTLNTDKTLLIFNIIKLIFSSIGFAAVVIYYIKWNDNWFRRHADEEFNMKRFQLDIERASWVVEMAMEWQQEKGTEIPPELLEKLTNNLFDNINNENLSQSSDSVVSKILGGSSELNLDIPNFGSVKLNKKGIKELKSAID